MFSGFIIVLMLSSGELSAQRFMVKKKKDIAFDVNLGVGNLLGDLGGADAPGSNSLKDFDPQAIRWTTGLGYILKPSRTLYLRSQLQIASLHGSDRYTSEKFRSNRNITVNTFVVSMAALGEVKIPLSKAGIFGEGPFLTVHGGLGGIYFNPKGRYEGESYKLRKIGTEGQNLIPGKAPYSKFAFNIPFGGGLRYYTGKNNSLGLELTANKSFTDYLDDVSTVYYDNEKIRSDQGDAAAYLADPNLSGVKRPSGKGKGNPKQKDHFFLLSFSYRYTFGSDRLF